MTSTDIYPGDRCGRPRDHFAPFAEENLRVRPGCPVREKHSERYSRRILLLIPREVLQRLVLLYPELHLQVDIGSGAGSDS